MLLPRLSGCLKCASIAEIIKDIDCKLDELSISLYNNIIFDLNNNISSSLITDLINYKKILMYKLSNDQYLCKFSINQISSRVKILTSPLKNCCSKKD